MKTSSNPLFQFRVGHYLRGEKASYEITELIGGGAWGQTYKARVQRGSSVSDDIKSGSDVVLKTPTLDTERSFDDQLDRVAQIHATLVHEYIGHDRLKGLNCVARVLDAGSIALPMLVPGMEAPAMFVAQRFINGLCLRQYIESRQEYLTNGKFAGIPRADEFLKWGRMLACALLQVHRRQVIHGDIWPNNIMVDLTKPMQPNPVLIDFGLAAFRDLTAGVSGSPKSPHGFMAPEGNGSVSADIYALGGVLYYLAVGSDPPIELRDIRGLDELKDRISIAANGSLLADNCGVADVITRCLRYDPQDRIPHAEGVLEDIETFMYAGRETATLNELPSWPCESCLGAAARRPPREVAQLPKALEELKNNPLFFLMADVRARRLLRDVQDMAQGVYDLVGDHEELVGALSRYLSVLGKDDEYLTVSIPSFWQSRNLGVNGRFLSTNRLVAQKGAVVQRVFIIMPEELKQDDVRAIIEAHRIVMNTVGWQRETGRHAEPGHPGYFAAVKIVSASEREQLLRARRHFGLLRTKGKQALLIPLYRGDGVLAAMQFRTQIHVKEYRDFFQDIVRQATPLTELTDAT